LQVSQFCQRPFTVSWCLLVLAVVGAAPAAAATQAEANDTWHLLAPLPVASQDPLFALDVDPTAADHLLAGTAGGSVFRSMDGGSSWKLVASHLGDAVLAIAFDPLLPTQVLAGTRGGGIWRSANGGESWDPVVGTAPRTVRAFGFVRDLTVAATDRGLLASRDGTHWTAQGPDNVNLSAVALSGSGAAAHLLVGSDAGAAGAGLPLYASQDAGKTWSRIGSSMMGSSMVDVLAAWPADGGTQLVLGTNAGVFSSADDGAHWSAISGGGTLPAADVTGVRMVANEPDRYYVASDGGASDEGGLWATHDGGQHFTALKPPVPAVTALSLGAGTVPTIYAATFRPVDHAIMLWSYRDDGGPPQPGSAVPAPRATGPATAGAAGRSTGRDWLSAALRGPEAPFLAISVVVVVLLVVAWVTFARRTRRF
jgi:photosystem II stability/assembly factor-like uncharacterized protein